MGKKLEGACQLQIESILAKTSKEKAGIGTKSEAFYYGVYSCNSGFLKTGTDRFLWILRTDQIRYRLVRFGSGTNRTNRAAELPWTWRKLLSPLLGRRRLPCLRVLPRSSPPPCLRNSAAARRPASAPRPRAALPTSAPRPRAAAVARPPRSRAALPASAAARRPAPRRERELPSAGTASGRALAGGGGRGRPELAGAAGSPGWKGAEAAGWPGWEAPRERERCVGRGAARVGWDVAAS